MLELLVLEAFLEEFKCFLKEWERVSRVGRVLQCFNIAGECLRRVAEEVSTYDGLTIGKHVANASLDCPHRDIHGGWCAWKEQCCKRHSETKPNGID